MKPEARIQSGESFGKYLLKERLFQSDASYVFRVEGRRGGSDLPALALKIVKSASDTEAASVQTFLDEMRKSRRIRHANVVPTFDFGRHAHHLFIAMEFVEGLTLGELVLRGGACPSDVVASIGIPLMEGLRAIHQATGEDRQLLRLRHQNLKPSNVLVSNEGIVKVTDVGTVCSTHHLSSSALNTTLADSLRWYAPEYASGAEADERSDLFSAGALLYYAATGAPLYADLTLNTLVKQVREGQTRPAFERLRQSALASWLVEVLEKLLGPAQDRFASAEQVIQALKLGLATEGAGSTPDAILRTWIAELPQRPPAKEQAPLAGIDTARATASQPPVVYHRLDPPSSTFDTTNSRILLVDEGDFKREVEASSPANPSAELEHLLEKKPHSYLETYPPENMARAIKPGPDEEQRYALDRDYSIVPKTEVQVYSREELARFCDFPQQGPAPETIVAVIEDRQRAANLSTASPFVIHKAQHRGDSPPRAPKSVSVEEPVPGTIVASLDRLAAEYALQGIGPAGTTPAVQPLKPGAATSPSARDVLANNSHASARLASRVDRDSRHALPPLDPATPFRRQKLDEEAGGELDRHGPPASTSSAKEGKMLASRRLTPEPDTAELSGVFTSRLMMRHLSLAIILVLGVLFGSLATYQILNVSSNASGTSPEISSKANQRIEVNPLPPAVVPEPEPVAPLAEQQLENRIEYPPASAMGATPTPVPHRARAPDGPAALPRRVTTKRQDRTILRIETPAESVVTLDGNEMAPATVLSMGVKPGEHKLIVTRLGGSRLYKSVTVLASATITCKVDADTIVCRE